jgi:hypothetical protein
VAPKRGRTKTTTWHWEQPDPMVSGSSGDLAKLFRNEGVKHPGVLAANAPSATATIMAREVIQNSWDAANDLRRQIEALGQDWPEFSIEFHFRRLEGAAKQALVSGLDLPGLRSHLQGPERHQLGLGDADCLDHLDDDEPITVLEVRESGGSGMYGPFTSARSKLYLALISLGYTVKHEGAGGSFGFGKAGLIRASKVRSLVAYTCFLERADDPDATRRLLGMTYWGQHELAGESFNGFARFGKEHAGGRVPFVNEEADVMAESLGLAARSAEHASDLGSSFLLVDPVVDAADLTQAIARNWWPALIDRAFVVKVIDVDGKVSVPRPRTDEILKPFIRGYELAVTPQDNAIAHEYSKKLARTYAKAGTSLATGAIGLTAKLDGWSYPNELAADDDEAGLGHRSLVALVRGPRMVVEYLDVGSHPPFVRGAFVADPEVDDLLRQSEPMAHDAWQTKVEVEGIDAAAPKVAESVTNNVKGAVREFRKRLKPPLPKEDDIRLPMLQDLMRKLLSGKGPVPPPPPPNETRLLSVSVDQDLKAAGTDEVYLVARVAVSLSEHIEVERAKVQVELKYRFVEDNRTGEECPAVIEPPAGFTRQSDGSYIGVLGHGKDRFVLTTEPYSCDWTGRLVADGKILVTDPLLLESEDES